jgi:hypothetical protein
MTDDSKKNSKKRLVLVVWSLVAFYYFFISYDYIRTEMNDDRMGAYVHYVVQLAGNEARTPKEVRALLLVKADELKIPLKAEGIKVQGAGQSLKVSLEYDVNIDVPIFQYGFYSKHYEHDISYRQMR